MQKIPQAYQVIQNDQFISVKFSFYRFVKLQINL